MSNTTLYPIEVAQHIYLIDDKLYSIPEFDAVYLINSHKKALVESGPAISSGIILDSIRQVGVKPEEAEYILEIDPS